MKRGKLINKDKLKALNDSECERGKERMRARVRERE